MVAVDTCSEYVRVNKKNGNQELSHIFANLVIRGPGSGARVCYPDSVSSRQISTSLCYWTGDFVYEGF